MKKIYLFALFIVPASLIQHAVAQQTTDTPIEHFVPRPPPDHVFKAQKVAVPFTINGRIVGVNLEDVSGAQVTNICSGETVLTNSRGIYQLKALKGDAIGISFPKYSKEIRIIKSEKDPLNVVLFKRKADNLPPGHTEQDYNKARRDDEDLLRILEKDAKLEDKWKY